MGGGQNLPFPVTLASGSYNTACLPYKPWLLLLLLLLVLLYLRPCTVSRTAVHATQGLLWRRVSDAWRGRTERSRQEGNTRDDLVEIRRGQRQSDVVTQSRSHVGVSGRWSRGHTSRARQDLGQVLSLPTDVENTQLLRREDSDVFRVVWNARHDAVVPDVAWVRSVPLRSLLEVSSHVLSISSMTLSVSRNCLLMCLLSLLHSLI